MKHISLSFITASILLLVSCYEDNKHLVSINEENAVSMHFYARIESQPDSTTTKSTLSGTSTDAVRKVLWEPNDSIYVTNGTSGSTFYNDFEENTDVTDFSGKISRGDNYFAVFPYGIVSGFKNPAFQLTIPTVQTYKADGVGSESFPMIAQCIDNIFEFKNLCGILVLNLTGSTDIDSIRFSGFDDKDRSIPISGFASVSTSYSDVPSLVMNDNAKDYVVLDCVDSDGKGVSLNSTTPTSFHIVLPAETYANFKIVIYSSDRRTMTIKSQKPLTIKRSKRTTASSIEYLMDPPEYEFIDLGLSVKWATCNVGAFYPEETGDYYAWGEVEPYYEDGYAQENPQTHWKEGKSSGYSWASYKWCNASSNALTKYVVDSKYGTIDNKTTLDLEDDVAYVKWRKDWRTPTKRELSELINNCTWVWTKENGVDGYRITSKVTGFTEHSIFLPYVIYRSGTGLGSWGGLYGSSHYMSSSLGIDKSTNAYKLVINSNSLPASLSEEDRSIGCQVRPVCPSDEWLSHISVSLYDESLCLVQDGTYNLVVNVKYDGQYYSYLPTFSSDNPSVATVNDDGIVTAVSQGIAHITVSMFSFSTQCTITVKDESEIEHKYVDLGLSVNWATCNVGATKPEGNGSYYAWGETETKNDYSASTYKWDDGTGNVWGWSYNFTKYYDNIDSKTNLDLEDDVAHVKWGGDWRMPTMAEQDELVNNCTWAWYGEGNSEFDGVAGFKITSNLSGYTDRFIFLPAVGYRNGTDFTYVSSYAYYGHFGYFGFYWSSSLVADDMSAAWFLDLDSCGRISSISRYYGGTVRPVFPSEEWLSHISLSFNEESLILVQDDTYNISANVKYDGKDYSYLPTFSSNNPSIATVDETGLVTAISNGEATITASCYGITATCKVIVTTPEYVDLGLSVNWATFNVGSTKPEDYGNYFAWGETETKANYSWDNYKFRTSGSSNDNVMFSKYNITSSSGFVDNKTTLDLEDDVAHVQWGGNWRMPTKIEQDELREKCTWRLATENGVNGVRVTSNIPGYTDNSIFLPLTGYSDGANIERLGSNGKYWSSSLSITSIIRGHEINFYSGGVLHDVNIRSQGLTVRPVCQSEVWLKDLSVTLNNNTKYMDIGDKYSLSATVKHGNDILDREVTWSSSNPYIAVVNETGVVTGVGIGTTIITATCLGKTATCSVTINFTEYVDLGLSVKWATCNLGASSPEGYGDYYAWGEIVTRNQTDISNINNYNYSGNYVRSYYTWATYKWGDGTPSGSDVIKYSSTDGKKTLELGDDVANHIKGGKWRMPTSSELSELRNNCTWTWSTINGVNGYVVKSNINNNSIFLPAAGAYYHTAVDSPGKTGSYWSSSLEAGSYLYAYYVFFSASQYNNIQYGSGSLRDVGCSIRPVYDENINTHEYVDLGLSVKWATCNIGASSPEDYGSYYAWGETVTKSSYTWENYKYRTSGNDWDNVKFSKYNTSSDYGVVDNKKILDAVDDVAHVEWGGNWRMPSNSEYRELVDNCKWTWTTRNGVNGFLVTSKKSGYTSNSIFLPAAGYFYLAQQSSYTQFGYYWCRDLYDHNANANSLLMDYSGNHGVGFTFRLQGLPVRPVIP